MLDIQFIRDNPELVAAKSAQRAMTSTSRTLLGFDTETPSYCSKSRNYAADATI